MGAVDNWIQGTDYLLLNVETKCYYLSINAVTPQTESFLSCPDSRFLFLTRTSNSTSDTNIMSCNARSKVMAAILYFLKPPYSAE